jgi:hypothetical protein
MEWRYFEPRLQYRSGRESSGQQTQSLAIGVEMQGLRELELSSDELADFKRMARVMIPADETFGVPGADDPLIFADISSSLGMDLKDVRVALSGLRALAGCPLSDLEDARAAEVIFQLLAQEGRPVQALGRVVLAAYYRDDRVMRSIGREPRAPYPTGHTLPDGDWSLLEVVKARAPIWRDDRQV